MQGEFLSGVVRAAKNPVDGQLYTVGLDGWGDYATQDGCFQRIRYTGKTLYKPTSYKVYHNGLKITFPIKLNAPSVEKAENYFAHIWEYLNSKQYGSPEYSVGAETLGHNVLPVRSAKVLDDGYSLFVEIPQLQLCMQMHLRLHLEAADGHSFKTDLFPTIKTLGDYFPFEGAAAQINNKSQNFIVRAEEEVEVKLHTQSGTTDEHAREIVIQTKNMQYDLKEIKVTEGESLLLNLKNIDGMPHNLVITTEKDYTSVGMASFKMLNDPKAVKKHYIPDMKEVLAYTFIVQPKGSHKLYLKAPTKGRYTFFCTFPGHWQLMKGTLIVE